MSIDAMKQALEVLSLELPMGSHLELKNALRAAIEEAQPDARAHHKMMVAMTKENWRRIDPQWKNDPELCHALGYEAGFNDAVARRVEPRLLRESGAGFESLPASSQWQGLTAEEIHEVVGKKWWDWEDAFDIEGFSRAIEAKLREKNR